MCCVGLVIGELPIILFNLGLDEEGKIGANKIEERLLTVFLDSKNNLSLFAKGVKEIEKVIKSGMQEYDESKKINEEFLD
jgi:hypothetical protein